MRTESTQSCTLVYYAQLIKILFRFSIVFEMNSCTCILFYNLTHIALLDFCEQYKYTKTRV